MLVSFYRKIAVLNGQETDFQHLRSPVLNVHISLEENFACHKEADCL